MLEKHSCAVSAGAASRNILGRWLHFGIAVCMVLCLALGWLAGRWGAAGASLGSTIAFNLHKFIGLNGLLLVALFLTWSARGHARSPSELFPWFSPARLRRVLDEWRGARAGLDLPATAAMVQGCGILAAGIATTSGLMLVLLSLIQDGGALRPTRLASALSAIHSAADAALWTYLVVHVGAVVVHSLKGERERCARMFSLLQPDHEAGASPASKQGASS